MRFTRAFVALRFGGDFPRIRTVHADALIGWNRDERDFEDFPVDRSKYVFRFFSVVIDLVLKAHVRENSVPDHPFGPLASLVLGKADDGVLAAIFAEPCALNHAKQIIRVVVEEERHVLLPFADPDALRRV